MANPIEKRLIAPTCHYFFLKFIGLFSMSPPTWSAPSHCPPPLLSLRLLDSLFLWSSTSSPLLAIVQQDSNPFPSPPPLLSASSTHLHLLNGLPHCPPPPRLCLLQLPSDGTLYLPCQVIVLPLFCSSPFLPTFASRRSPPNPPPPRFCPSSPLQSPTTSSMISSILPVFQDLNFVRDLDGQRWKIRRWPGFVLDFYTKEF